MKLKIKKLNPNAVMPFKTHDNDFCYDCVAVSREELAPNVYKYGTKRRKKRRTKRSTKRNEK